MKAPDTVAPTANKRVNIDGFKLKARFKPGSWNVIVTSNGSRTH
jgi:alpha-N-arabinofuranosidase